MRPVLILNPRTDPAFTGRVRALVDAGVDEPTTLESRLRGEFPRISVHPRDLSSERYVVWYVYRDGRWTPESPTPRVTSPASGRA